VCWYRAQARDLPWRRTTDPYRIWIAEVMLQQTQVATVIPYWNRWVAQLPTLEALARARETRVLKLWEGLGYYRRARHLRAAARQILRDHGGVFPRDLRTLLRLPGIGRYTAGAICSIAFNQAAPILDGNVSRVLTRFLARKGDPRQGPNRRFLWAQAERLVATAAQLPSRGAPPCADLNQALMELGAVVCTPRAPRCAVCPLACPCAARRTGRVEAFPASRQSRRALRRRMAVFVLERHGRFLLRRRPTSSVNGGLWEFPSAELQPGGSSARGLAEAEFGARRALQPLLQFNHTITRYRIRVEVYRLTLARPLRRSRPRERWCGPRQLAALPLSAAHRRIARALKAFDRQPATTRSGSGLSRTTDEVDAVRVPRSA
jgi:A/G-specific adenine glycosylase